MNRLFRRIRSFGDRIAIVVTATSGVAVIAVALPLAITDYLNVRSERLQTVRSHAAMVALDSGAALVFEDAANAHETLALLRAVPDIAAAVLYDRGKRHFASYQRISDSAPVPPPEPSGERSEDGWMHVSVPVVDLGETQGQLQIVYDLRPLRQRLRASLVLSFAVALGAMALAYLIARRARRDLAAPIDALVIAATTVSRTGDYSRRAEKISDDELGELADAFNEMLARIQKQEGDLHSAYTERGALLEKERAARGEAERASRVKDEFLATLSHELRTPLTPILGWVDILKQVGASDAETRHGLEVVERNARVLTHIIDDLLDMSRIVSGKVRLDVQRVELPEVIEAAIATVRPAAEARSIRIQSVLDPNARWVRGDPARLQQVVWNLLSNAIRFTGKGGRVQVGLARVNSHVEISVSDTGAGIAPEFLPHVFDRFRQADSTITRQHGGLGLGLAIARELVELHGGTIRAASPGEGQGATFTVELPLMLVHADEPDGPREHPVLSEAAPVLDLPSLQGVRVLVVEDDADARSLMTRVLVPHGATVLTAESGADALAALAVDPPDVLISDIGMPGMDGYELIRQVRELGAARGGAVPAIALTAFARSEDRTRALLAGYQLHLAKPVPPAELVVAIASLRHGSGARKERSLGGSDPAAS